MINKIIYICMVMFCLTGKAYGLQLPEQDDLEFTYDDMPDVLPGTNPFIWEGDQGDLSAKILNGAHRFIDRKIDESIATRSELWDRDFTSEEAYYRSVEPNRSRFMKRIGVVDKNEPYTNYSIGLKDDHPPVAMERLSVNHDSGIVAETETYRVYQVRWPVLNRVHGEGLLVVPRSKPKANIIALPDADQTPEQLVGLSPGISPESQFARHLAENGFQVLIPLLIDRSFLHLAGRSNEQTMREWIYRQSFHMGRHIIGYEVQKVLSVVDWFRQYTDEDTKIGVAGYNEGGLLAFYSAAADRRIDAVLVSGYFDSRQQVWDEPIYRNVWGLLEEFGDAEIASLIAPRPMVIEHSMIAEELEESTRKPSDMDKFSYTGYKGSLKTPQFHSVQSEFHRIDELIEPDFQSRFLISDEGKPVKFGSKTALESFTGILDSGSSSLTISDEIPIDNRSSFDPEKRQLRQAKELEDHVQWLVRVSDYERDNFFLHEVMPEFNEIGWTTESYHPYFSPDRFIEKGKEYRAYFWEEILGKIDDPLIPPNPQSRKTNDEARWTGYEVVLDVYEDLLTAGVILIPKNIDHNERRPVVVLQHGRNGVPEIVIEGSTSYYNMGSLLADQGFIVYIPFGLFRGEDRYRWLDRKANTVKKTLFTFIISQHDQTLQWLGTLPFVDSDRIAFYGKSYGGETAMRVPAVLEGYSLSIVSADFGDWTRKVADTHFPRSFMNTIEWEMPYFNMGSTFSYAEMAYLIFPRPFMVERGRHDTVQPDQWVAYEYAKVDHLYDQFNLSDKTEIEYFQGGHASRNVGTFKFLRKHLNWP